MPDSPTQNDLLIPTKEGLFCPAGGFHVDPWRPVERAIVTHGHADHARRGSTHVLGAEDGLPVLERRIGGPGTTIEGVSYGHRMGLGDATVSLHPAGHVLGSAQVRIEVEGRVWVFSGDYATLPNPTCVAFEPIRCHRFITECTFGLPLYRWKDPATVGIELRRLVDSSLGTGRSVVLGAYGLGKAQRLIQLLAGDEGIGVPIACHGSVQSMNDAYRDAGVRLPETIPSTLEALAAILPRLAGSARVRARAPRSLLMGALHGPRPHRRRRHGCSWRQAHIVRDGCRWRPLLPGDEHGANWARPGALPGEHGARRDGRRLGRNAR